MKTIDGKTLLATSLPLLFSALAAADGTGIFTVHDRNHDGYLDREEFRQSLERRPIRPEYRHLWVFEQVDTDGDGLISNMEMVETLQKEMKLRRQKKTGR